MTTPLPGRVNWSFDEVLVLAAIYWAGNFSIGDDERDECQTIADCFGRSPASIDRQWRNFGAVLAGKTNLNISRVVYEVAAQYSADPRSHQRLALQVCNKNQWPLTDLITKGELDPGHMPVVEEINSQVLQILKTACEKVDFVLLPTGTQGFEVNQSIQIERDLFRLKITALSNRSRNSDFEITTKRETMVTELSKCVDEVRLKRFASGRPGFFANLRRDIDGNNYRVSIKATRIGDEDR